MSALQSLSSHTEEITGWGCGKKKQKNRIQGEKKHCSIVLTNQHFEITFCYRDPFFLLQSIIHIYLKSIRSMWDAVNREQQRKTFRKDTTCCMFLSCSLSQFDLHFALYWVFREPELGFIIPESHTSPMYGRNLILMDPTAIPSRY